MKIKTILLGMAVAVIPATAMAQRTFADIMGRKLIAVGYASAKHLGKDGKPQMYGQKTPLTWQLNNDGTFLWNGNGEKTYNYTLKDSTLALNGTNYELKFFIDSPYTRDNQSYKGYIIAQSNDGWMRYFKLNPADCYTLYEKALSENRLYAAYDYMLLLNSQNDAFAECALAFLEEAIEDFPGDGDGTVRYLMADYYVTTTPEEIAQKSQNISQMLAESGLISSRAAELVTIDKPYFSLDERQKKLILSFANQRVGVGDLFYPHEDEEERLANISGGIESFQRAIEATNDAVSNFYLGKIYYEGLLGFKEKTLGMKHIQSAAAQGSALANCYLGNLRQAEGNTAEARKLWKLAASAKLQRPQLQITTLETLASPNPDMPEVREAVKRAKDNLKK